MVHTVSTLTEFEELLKESKNKNKLIVVDFFATWCGPCLRIAPKIEDWSTNDFKDKVLFVKVDVDQAEELSQKYEVEAMPTFVFFKDGDVIHRVVGANVDQLKADIEKHK